MRILLMLFSLLYFSKSAIAQSAKATKKTTTIPLAGNTFFSNYGEQGIELGKTGLTNWTDPSVTATVFVRFLKTGAYHVFMTAKAKSANTLEVKIEEKSRNITINGADWKKYDLGVFNITDTGYVGFRLYGLNKKGAAYTDIKSLEINASHDKFQFVKDEFYWGRRGPSVHLNYTLPPREDIEWFYNEITIPADNDVMGSYFMSNGFGEGYFGIQVNSPTERRVLFSVWSPFETDDPKSIPDAMKIVLLNKGKGVHTGEFGNEGSGGQSYLVFDWQAELTYKFLTRVKPNSDNSTTYTSYFFDPLTDKWLLIASFKRPQTHTWYTDPHSFLENFDPERGAVNRAGFYNNQWALNKKDKWTELTTARFTNDATARKKARMDFWGGVEDNQFVLRNCGFFSEYTPLNTILTRQPTGRQPVIDFKNLPKE